jgi:NAD(P)-dependent dehydrogenase (short-subunit alcohol dehydrogenase family)
MDDKRVALVTGSSSGFGLLSCLELAARGLRVFATMRDLSRSQRLDGAARQAGVEVEKVALDVSLPGSIAKAVEEIERRAGRIDVLVNNAGFGMAGFLEDLSMEELREQMETNFFGAVGLMKAVLPGMRGRRSGRIINVSSLNARVAVPALSAYSASKCALEGLSEAVRHEVRPFGIKVVLVEPGQFKTDIFDRNRRMARRSLEKDSPYYAQGQAMLAVVEKQVAGNTADPRAVARTIARAATAKRPALRYLVGLDAHLMVGAKALLPFWLIESVLGRALHTDGDHKTR